MENEEESKVSKYNSGIAKLIRLNSLWIDVNNHSRQRIYAKWNEDLDRIWSELSADLKDIEEKEEDIQRKDKTRKRKDEKGNKILYFDEEKKKIDDFDTKIANEGEFIDTEPQGFVNITNEMRKKRANQYKLLLEKEIYLRKLENKLGKGTAWDDEDEDSWD